MSKDLPHHPAADLFPPMTAGELQELTDDIRERGLLNPIITLDGALLDGVHRLQACTLAGVEPRFTEWSGEGGSPVAFAVSQNVRRRQLTSSQKAALAAEVLPLFEQEAKERQGRRTDLMATVPESQKSAPTSRDQAAAVVGTGSRQVQEAKAIKERDPDLFVQVKNGEISITAASKKIGRAGGRQIGGGRSDRKLPKRTKLKEVLDPLDKYLKDWDGSRLSGISPAEARKMLPKVQRVHRALAEVAIELNERGITSRALS
jgi:hypothetical protein